MSRINRRRFLEHSLLATTATLVLPGMTREVRAQPMRRRRSANDVIRIGVIGVRGRGRAHIGAFKKSPDAEVVAICDADSGVIGPAQESVPDATYYQDMREMLADPTIDAVSIAMPNHWHSLATIWALEAGKHVYVEKPISAQHVTKAVSVVDTPLEVDRSRSCNTARKRRSHEGDSWTP